MLKTEMRNQRTMHIDRMSTAEMVRILQDENLNAALSIEKALCAIERAIDEIARRMAKGGRLFYVGCGTSGRLGVLDASECPPTYGVSYDLVVGVIAGGDEAIRKAVEGAEDHRKTGTATSCPITSPRWTASLGSRLQAERPMCSARSNGQERSVP